MRQPGAARARRDRAQRADRDAVPATAANQHHDDNHDDLQHRRYRAHGSTAAARGGDPAVSRSANGLGAWLLEFQWSHLGLDPRALRDAATADGTVGTGSLGSAARWGLGLGRWTLDQLSPADARAGVEKTAAHR